MKRSILLVLAFALSSCKPSLVPIGDLTAHPAKYDGKSVAVVGQVKGQVGITDWTAYELVDSTGTITVATQTTTYPLTGIRLGAGGTFRASMKFLEGARPTLLEAKRWNPDKAPMVRPAPDPADTL
jgi:hypothetical protein